MAQFLLSQYTIKKINNPNNNNQAKKVDKSKKDDNNNLEDRDKNTTGTAGAYIGEAALDKDKAIAPSNASSIGAHILDINTIIVPSPCCVYTRHHGVTSIQ